MLDSHNLNPRPAHPPLLTPAFPLRPCATCCQDKPLSDYNHADLSVALIRMISYNIGQLAYLNAMRYNIKRIFFGGCGGHRGGEGRGVRKGEGGERRGKEAERWAKDVAVSE